MCSHASPDVSDDRQIAPLAELVAFHQQRVKQVRTEGSPTAIVACARTAADAIQHRVGAVRPELSEDERAALVAARRLMYNAAADCWPGWAADGPRGSEADLTGALELARRSAYLVEALALGPMQDGTAAWLVGAFELALDRTGEALASFSRAELRYRDVPAPAMALLAQGYVAIACEAGRLTRPAGVPNLEQTLEAITAGAFEDGEALCEQLRTARQVFA